MLVQGAIFVIHHLPRRSADGHRPPLQEPALPNTAQLDAARHELDAGHYAAAEALFREIAANEPNVQPMAELCAAMQLWERGEFRTGCRWVAEIR